MTKTVYYTDRFDSPQSKAISGAWYNQDAKELWVDFYTGARAGYKNVHLGSWEAFKNSGSKGRHYAAYIRNQFGGTSGDVVFVPGYDDTPTSIPTQTNDTESLSTFKVVVRVTRIEEVTVESGSIEGAITKAYDALSIDDSFESIAATEVTQYLSK